VRKELPIVICAICAIIYIVSTYISPTLFPAIAGIKTQLDVWYLLVFACAFAVGLVNLAQIHVRRVSQKRESWQFSLILLVFMFVTLILGIFTTGRGTYTDWLYQWWLVNPRATMFSILVFYIASAAYRAFRIKSFEASVLLVAAIIMKEIRSTVSVKVR